MKRPHHRFHPNSPAPLLLTPPTPTRQPAQPPHARARDSGQRVRWSIRSHGGRGVPDTVHAGGARLLAPAQVPPPGGRGRRQVPCHAAAGRVAARRRRVGRRPAAARAGARGPGRAAARAGAGAGREGVGDHAARRRPRRALDQAGAAPEAAAGAERRPDHGVRAAAHLRDLQVHRRVQGAHRHAPLLRRAPAAGGGADARQSPARHVMRVSRGVHARAADPIKSGMYALPLLAGSQSENYQYCRCPSPVNASKPPAAKVAACKMYKF
uniref:Uncharacterized protein n=1 Tax=Setaria italica TaxID=4555 RepID=K3Z8U3_SETIT